MRALIFGFLLVFSGCVNPGAFEVTQDNYGWVDYQTDHFYVATNGYGVNVADFYRYSDDILLQYQRAVYAEGWDCPLHGFYAYVSYQPQPFVYENALFSGLMIPSYTYPTLLVGWVPNIEQTALAHEMGHAILLYCHQAWGESALYAFTSNYGLPY